MLPLIIPHDRLDAQTKTPYKITINGRCRAGKTTLLLNWAERSGVSTMYWVARRETAQATRQNTKEILLGECKWGADPINRQVAQELVERKGPRVRRSLSQGDAWTFQYALFARAGFTDAAVELMTAQKGLLVTLSDLDEVMTM